ncbi:hypothetical protein CDL15_Pgr016282 [Punica granatum]|uniref:Uncharacterized protein n=1 Tax=Punica granatum TaxID=22663 RepID=A0A218X167_PUNGR|nr:hypothetical protein CDL15_Pgr016282 [Punica granatum]PKI68854.1 hypothetical protein CRG98_010911 [Punica granatum]
MAWGQIRSQLRGEVRLGRLRVGEARGYRAAVRRGREAESRWEVRAWMGLVSRGRRLRSRGLWGACDSEPQEPSQLGEENGGAMSQSKAQPRPLCTAGKEKEREEGKDGLGSGKCIYVYCSMLI